MHSHPCAYNQMQFWIISQSRSCLPCVCTLYLSVSLSVSLFHSLALLTFSLSVYLPPLSLSFVLSFSLLTLLYLFTLVTENSRFSSKSSLLHKNHIESLASNPPTEVLIADNERSRSLSRGGEPLNLFIVGVGREDSAIVQDVQDFSRGLF